eukprot:1242418-Ditylum_brightwellii.AAC.1
MYGNNKAHYDNKVCTVDFWYDDDEAFDDHGAYDDNKINRNDKNDDNDLLLDDNETYGDNNSACKDLTKANLPP